MLAFLRVRNGKTRKEYVIEFESDLENNLPLLNYELMTFAYKPSPMMGFVIRDPKTRRISASHSRDA